MFWQIGQAQSVCDVAPALADDTRNVAMRIPVVGAELGVARGFLESVEIRALHIFDDGDLERLAVASLDDDDGDIVEPRALRRPPAPLASNDFVSIRDAGNGADHDGLDDSALFDRSGEFVEFPVVKSLSRVAGIWPQELDRRPSPAACEFGMLFVHGAQQRGEPPPQARPMFGRGCVFGHGSWCSFAR